MNNEQNPIDDLFRSGLKDSGIAPPPGVWEAVSAGMPAAAGPGVAAVIVKSAWTWIAAGTMAVAGIAVLLSSDQPKPQVKAVQPEQAVAGKAGQNTFNQSVVEPEKSTRNGSGNEVQIQGNSQSAQPAVSAASNVVDRSSNPNEVAAVQESSTPTQPRKEKMNRLVVEEHHNPAAPPCGRNLKVNATRSETDNSWMFTAPNAPAGAYLSWNYGDGESGSGNPGRHIFPDMNAEYQVKVLVFRASNCIDSGVYRVVTRQRHPGLSIPDVFTPNGDGLNDELQITLPAVTQFNQVVTDKNGKQVFVNNNPSILWNGKSASMDCQPGTYRVTITYKTDQSAKAVSFSKLILLNR